MGQEEVKKGPWTEQEDFQLTCFVGLFGDRRWDFIARVSGLNRTGKSCRLRWVNYLNPGLKRGKMTPQEERLILELHSKWGNRWSKIARRLPGRTDNEIKNYWRTYMRKKAQERKQALSSSSSSSNNSTASSAPFPEAGSQFICDIEEAGTTASAEKRVEEEDTSEKSYSMDDIWKDMDLSEDSTIRPSHECCSDKSCCFSYPAIDSLTWDYCPEALWNMDDEDCNFISSQHLSF